MVAMLDIEKLKARAHSPRERGPRWAGLLKYLYSNSAQYKYLYSTLQFGRSFFFSLSLVLSLFTPPSPFCISSCN